MTSKSQVIIFTPTILQTWQEEVRGQHAISDQSSLLGPSYDENRYVLTRCIKQLEYYWTSGRWSGTRQNTYSGKSGISDRDMIPSRSSSKTPRRICKYTLHKRSDRQWSANFTSLKCPSVTATGHIAPRKEGKERRSKCILRLLKYIGPRKMTRNR